MEAEINPLIRNSFPRAILLGLIGAIVAGSLVVYTNIQATNLTPSGGSGISLAVNTFTDDPEVTIDNASLSIVSASTGAVGDAPAGIEAGLSVPPYPAVNSILTVDNYAYTFDMHETLGGDWEADTLNDFRIRVFGFDAGGPTSTLLSTLYAQQAAADGGVEGVTVTIDLTFNTAVYDNFDIIVDRQ